MSPAKGPCKRCGSDEWYRDKRGQRSCAVCQRARVTKRRNELQKDQAYRLWRNAQERARVMGLPFTVTIADIAEKIGTHCPVTGKPWGKGRDAPSLDRLRPRDGYTPSNIAVISLRANAVKSDANSTQVLQVYRWMKRKGL